MPSLVASRRKMRVAPPSPSAATFSRISARASAPSSTNSAKAAPRDIASSPSAPVPANRSSTRAPVTGSPWAWARMLNRLSRSRSAVGRIACDSARRARGRDADRRRCASPSLPAGTGGDACALAARAQAVRCDPARVSVSWVWIAPRLLIPPPQGEGGRARMRAVGWGPSAHVSNPTRLASLATLPRWGRDGNRPREIAIRPMQRACRRAGRAGAACAPPRPRPRPDRRAGTGRRTTRISRFTARPRWPSTLLTSRFLPSRRRDGQPDVGALLAVERRLDRRRSGRRRWRCRRCSGSSAACVDRAVGAHAVAPQPAGRRQLEHAREPAVVGQQQQALGVDVEPADR